MTKESMLSVNHFIQKSHLPKINGCINGNFNITNYTILLSSTLIFSSRHPKSPPSTKWFDFLFQPPLGVLSLKCHRKLEANLKVLPTVKISWIRSSMQMIPRLPVVEATFDEIIFFVSKTIIINNKYSSMQEPFLTKYNPKPPQTLSPPIFVPYHLTTIIFPFITPYIFWHHHTTPTKFVLNNFVAGEGGPVAVHLAISSLVDQTLDTLQVGVAVMAGKIENTD